MGLAFPWVSKGLSNIETSRQNMKHAVVIKPARFLALAVILARQTI